MSSKCATRDTGCQKTHANRIIYTYNMYVAPLNTRSNQPLAGVCSLITLYLALIDIAAPRKRLLRILVEVRVYKYIALWRSHP